MSFDIKKVIKNSGVYAFGIILGRAASFIMLPIYTRFLTPEDYGTIELLVMTVDIFGMIAGVGLTAAVYRFYFKYDSQKERNHVISTIMILLISIYCITSVLGVSISDSLAGWILNGKSEEIYFFQLIFITFFFQSFVEVPMLLIKAQQRPFLFVVINSMKLIVALSLNIYFIVVLKMGVLGVLYSTLITTSVTGILLMTSTFRTVGFRFSTTLSKKLIIFGTPLIFSNLGGFILTFSDRFFLKAYSDLTTVGIYSLGYKLGFLLWVFPVRPIMDVWVPQRFEIAKQSNFQQINAKVFFFLNLMVIFVALLFSLFSLDLFRVMSDPQFWDAYKIVPIIMIAYIIQGLTSFGNFGVMYSGQTRCITIGSVVAAVTILFLSFVLIPKYHAYGAAIATVIAFFVRFLIIFSFSQKYFYLKLPWKKFAFMFLLAVFCYSGSILFLQDNVICSIGVNFVCMMMFIIGIFLLPIFKKNEKQLFLQVLRHPIRTIKSGGFFHA